MNQRKKLTITIPAGNKWEPQTAINLASALMSLKATICLAIYVRPGSAEWVIEVGDRDTDGVINVLLSFYEDAEINIEDRLIDVRHHVYRLGFMQGFHLSLHSPTVLKADDPLRGLVGLCGPKGLREGEEVVFETHLIHDAEKYEKLIADIEKHEDPDNEDHQKDIVQKREGLRGLALSQFRILAGGQTRRQQIFEAAINGIKGLNDNTGNALMLANDKTYPTFLSDKEIAGMWHLPTDRLPSTGIRWTNTNQVKAPDEVTAGTEYGIVIGDNTFRGETKPVVFSYADRMTHANLVGKPGVGKSTLLLNMIAQDIHNGHGVGLIDPNGDLVEDVLRVIPEDRMEDVVYFNIHDTERPLGLNPFVLPPGLNSYEASTPIVNVLARLTAEGGAPLSPRMIDLLYASVDTLLHHPGATLADLNRLYSDDNFRYSLIQRMEDGSSSKDFWLTEFEDFSAREKSSRTTPITYRLRMFFRDPRMSKIMLGESNVNFRELIDNNKIFLANLSVPDEIIRDPLGALIISKIQLAVMGRFNVSREERTPFYLYIDEVQNFTSDDTLKKILQEARKYALSLTIANQHLSQLKGEVLESVIGNVGATIIFQVGENDAAALKKKVSPEFTDVDLLQIDPFKAVVKMAYERRSMPAFSIMTRPPISPQEYSEEKAEYIKKLSRERYGRPVENSTPQPKPVPDIVVPTSDDEFDIYEN